MPEKKSLKPIPPTLRGKKRYVLFRLLSNLHEADSVKGGAPPGQAAASPGKAGATTSEAKPFAGKTFAQKDVSRALNETFSALFGAKGMAEQKLFLGKWLPEKNSGIIRCSLKELESVKAGLLFIEKVQGADAVPLIERVSGSIRKLRG